jgi:hypothetical protein
MDLDGSIECMDGFSSSPVLVQRGILFFRPGLSQRKERHSIGTVRPSVSGAGITVTSDSCGDSVRETQRDETARIDTATQGMASLV